MTTEQIVAFVLRLIASALLTGKETPHVCRQIAESLDPTPPKNTPEHKAWLDMQAELAAAWVARDLEKKTDLPDPEII